MTEAEYDTLIENATAGGHCPICSSRNINTSGYCEKHQLLEMIYEYDGMGILRVQKIITK